MKRGIAYVVFGRDYDRAAAVALRRSRENTDLPFCVMTNIIAEKRSPEWKFVRDVKFVQCKLPREQNRQVKTRMDLYTPFEHTLYLDCDTVIQRKGIEKVSFDPADEQGADLALLKWGEFPNPKNGKFLKIYRDSMKQAGVKPPLMVYQGACLCFRNNARVKPFFITWNGLWKKFGGGREMPALAVSAKKMEGTPIKIGEMPNKLFAASGISPTQMIQHLYNKTVQDKFGVPNFAGWHVFDSDPTDFSWVMYDA